jgi:hypothetical protein
LKDLKFILTYNSVPTELVNSPDGWDDTLVKYDRSLKYWGLFRSYSIPLRFIKEGALILRTAFYTSGVNASATLTIQKLNRITLEYYTAYTAQFDFATFKDLHDFVDIILIDGELSAFIKKNESIKYDIEVTGYTVRCQGSLVYPVYYATCAELSDVLFALVDKVTDGGVTNGDIGIDTTVLDVLDKTIVLANTQVNASFDNSLPFKINTSLTEFIKSINGILPCGILIDMDSGHEQFALKELNEMFSDTQITTFINVNEFELGVETQLIFNSIKVGFPEKDSELSYLSKNFEPNATSYFRLPTEDQKVIKELDLTSVYSGDFSGLYEALRTADYEAKLMYYFLQIQDHDPEYPGISYDNKVYGTIRKKGTSPDPPGRYWNRDLSPVRILTIQKQVIESMLNIDSELLYSSSGYDNINNETNVIDDLFYADYKKEYEGITISKATSMFVPYIFKIDVPLTLDLNQIIGLASTGYISFTYNGNQYKGYIMSAGVKLAGRGVVEMKLLASYDNDFSTLIR